MTPDRNWPCRCKQCAPPYSSCRACGIPASEVCDVSCMWHPSKRATCKLRENDHQHRIARGDA